MTPTACAAAIASAAWARYSRTRGSSSGARVSRSRSVSPATSSIAMYLTSEAGRRRLDIGVADLVDRDQVRMVQARGGAGLVGESREPLGVAGERFGQHLQRDGAVELDVLGAIDLAHAAASEQRPDPIPAERCAG